MDRRAIGVFDSGLGGLTAVRELERLLPGEELIYFGDTGRVPYGGRSRETLVRYARQDMAFLRSFDLKAVLVACGTVSANALDVLTAENAIPVVGVVEPAARMACESTRTGRIGLIATAASVRTGAYERVIAAEAPHAKVFSAACPLFVPLVENGRFRAGDSVIETVAAEYLAPLKDEGIDTLVLGCTHYPLLTDVIAAFMGPDVTLINAGAAGARALADDLAARGALSDRGSAPRRFFVSDSVEGFSSMASLFLGEDVRGSVEQIDITAY